MQKIFVPLVAVAALLSTNAEAAAPKRSANAKQARTTKVYPSFEMRGHRIGAQGNMAIIEIKKPDTELVNNREYRGGVFAPHKDLTGAVTQVLDQRYQLQMDINNKKVASAQFDVFTYAMQCLVIAGRELDDLGHRKSFELFRNGLKDVTVITFSELLLKLPRSATAKPNREFLTKNGPICRAQVSQR